MQYITVVFNLYMNADLFFMKCDDRLIVGNYVGAPFLDVSHAYLWHILKNTFPQQYEVYKDGWQLIPNTGLIRRWILTFKDGKCINKEITES